MADFLKPGRLEKGLLHFLLKTLSWLFHHYMLATENCIKEGRMLTFWVINKYVIRGYNCYCILGRQFKDLHTLRQAKYFKIFSKYVISWFCKKTSATNITIIDMAYRHIIVIKWYSTVFKKCLSSSDRITWPAVVGSWVT